MSTYQSSRLPKTVFITIEGGAVTEVTFHSPYFTPKKSVSKDDDFEKKFELAFTELLRANQSSAKEVFSQIKDKKQSRTMKKILSARAAELSRKAADLSKFLSKTEEQV